MGLVHSYELEPTVHHHRPKQAVDDMEDHLKGFRFHLQGYARLGGYYNC